MPADTLADFRKKIDAIDSELLRLLNERAKLALHIGEVKKADGQTQYYHPHREQQLLTQLLDANRGPLTDEAILSIFRPTLAACRNLQQPVSIALLGPENTYSHLATQMHFGQRSQLYFQPNIDAVLAHGEKEPSHYGILPIRNSTTGLIKTHLNKLLKTPLSVCGEVVLPIRHCLLSKTTDKTPDIIYAHQQTLLQCQHWLAKHYPDSRYLAVASNALGAKQAADDAKAAAIASATCASTYDLQIIADAIADDPNNQTTFWIIGQQSTQPSLQDKTVLLVDCQDKSGNLSTLLAPFAEQGLNLSQLESHAISHPTWQYRFYIEVMAHQSQDNMQQALQALRVPAYSVTVLGSFAVTAQAL